MKYRVLRPLRISTPAEDRTLPEGQIITLPKEKAIPLIEKGKIEPVGRVAYRVYSEILEAFLWVVADDEDMKTPRTSQKVTEPIYTADEIRKLKGIDKEELKMVHKVKTEFPESIVQDMKLTDRENNRQS